MNVKGYLLLFGCILMMADLLAQSINIPVPGCNCTEDSKYHFIVTLTNDSQLVLTSKVEHLPTSGSSYLTYEKDGKPIKQIFPNDTKRLEITDYKHFVMIGIPTDTGWLFNTEMGKINLYSLYPVYQTENAKAFRSGTDGPILPLTLDNLLPFLKSDDKAMKTAIKGKLHRAVVLFNLGED